MATDPDATLQLAGPPAPRRLAQVELRQQVGAGAMGVVYQGHDLDLDRPVAVKLLHTRPGSPSDPKLVERFLREARSAAQLIHPNVALVYQVGRDAGLTFIVMEWLDGGDLSQAVRDQGPLPWREALTALRDAAAGLAAAHAAGLVHRDIKPSNLMRNRAGQVKLVDFGLARLHDAPSDLTLTGSILGTPAYLSPEQCCGDAATPASDLYALACTAFHLLTGCAPFASPQLAAVIHSHLNQPMPDVRQWAPDVPEAFSHIIQRAAAKRPAQRQAGAGVLLAELQALIDGRSPVTTALPLRPVDDPHAPRQAGNLPLETTSFIGRALEAEQLAELLQQSRLVTLTGPGGTGKTRLSLHVASRLASGFADGAWWVELAALPAGQPIVTTVAGLFGLRDSAGQSTDEALRAHLQSRHLLLVLDNCEHVIDAAAALAQRLHVHCPQVSLLATSRQPLGVAGELTLGVPPLSTGDDDTPLPALERVDAVRLFVDRARAARNGFVLNRDNAAAVVQICRRLDGIPLAIELAAARAKVLTPAQIAARLDDAFQLLIGGQRTQLPRQQTLRALVDWSWDLLDDDQRRLFERISVFSGDFSLEAAEAVLPDDDGDAAAVLDGLAGLVDQSLLVAIERGGTMRYRMLQTIRQYAAERLAARGDSLTLLRRQAQWATEWMIANTARLDGVEHIEALHAIALEHDNARAALDAVTAHRWFDIGLRLARALAGYWLLCGVLADGVARLERLMAEAPPAGAELAGLLQHAGNLAMYSGRHARAQQWFEQGLAIVRPLGRADLEIGLLSGIGSMAYVGGDLATARRCYERSRDLSRELRDRRQEAHALNNLAMVLKDQGLIDDARENLQAALVLHRASNNPRDIGNGLMNLGEIEHLSEHPEQAAALFQSALDILSAHDNEWDSAYALSGLGKCALAQRDLASARQRLEAALAVVRRLGDQAAVAEQLDLLAQLALHEQAHDSAVALADEGLALRLALNNPAEVSASLTTLAAALMARSPDTQAQLAAWLLGAAAVRQQAAGNQLAGADRRRLEGLRQQLRERLGSEGFERALADGADAGPAALAALARPAA